MANQTLVGTAVELEVRTTAVNAEATEPHPGILRFNYSKFIRYAHGQASSQADQVWQHSGTIGGGLTIIHDLRSTGAGNDIVDPFGDDIAFSHVRTMLIHNTSTIADTCVIAVGPDTSGTGWLNWMGAADLILIPPNGFMFLAVKDVNAYEITVLAMDIRLINGDGVNDSTYDIVIIGTRA